MLDRTGRLPGRGAYVCEKQECRNAALDKGSLQRALEVPIPEELRAELTGNATIVTRAASPSKEE